MMSPNEQELATLRDGLPRIWWAVYGGSVDAGFTSLQAFSLLQTYIYANGSANLNAPKGDSTATDDEPK